ncbi:MAG: DUF1674 domain-containing protein [Hyphomicrobiales bacterium]|nr:DUF1674 domain-containing protein [Hyphomicrobiales bacterium]
MPGDKTPGAPTESYPTPPQPPVKEIGGRADGTEPVNPHGEWVKNGKVVDF